MTKSDFIPDAAALEQLIPSEPLYRILFQLVYAEALEHIFYIGVEGDFRLVETLFKSRALKAVLPEINIVEAQAESFSLLKQTFSDSPQSHFYHGFTQLNSFYPDLAELTAFFGKQKTAWHQFPMDFWLEKAQQEMKFFADFPDSQKGLLKTISEQTSAPDMVILDGSDFTSHADLSAFGAAKIIVLTGVNGYRNHLNFNRLVNDSGFYLMYQNWQIGFGFAIFKRQPVYKPGVSVVIHTRNEAANIEKCLQSVSWAQECIVVDMFSQDNTRELAQAQGARIVPHIPISFIDEARNFGLAQVAFTWTLVLDADEQIPQALAQRLQELAQEPEGYTGFWLARQNWFFGQWMQNLFPDFQMRFFKSGHGAWTGMIHDFARIQGETAYLPADPAMAMQHYSYTSVADFCQRQLYYARSTVNQYQEMSSQLNIQSKSIRKDFLKDLEKLIKTVKNEDLDDAHWLTQTLYFFSNYLTGASLLEAFSLHKQAPAQTLLSGYTYLKNGVLFDYPFRESIRSVVSLCDQFVICYATDSEDNTHQELLKLAEIYPQIELHPSEVWRKNRGHEGEVIRLAAEEAMAYCRGEWLWHVQADEIYHEKDLDTLKSLLNAPVSERIDAYRFKILHFYGDFETCIQESAQEIGWYQRCIRLTRKGKAQHIKDAWTQILNPANPGQIKDVDIRIFHYGHVREAEAMRHKLAYMEKLYAPLPDDFEVCPEGEFVYDRIPHNYLQKFSGSHPQTMRLRLARTRLANQTQAPKPKILILSRHHKIKKGFGISLNEVFSTGILQKHFEVHHLAWHYHGADTIMDGVHVYATQQDDSLGLQRLKHILVFLEPNVVLLHADTHFFVSFLPLLEAWQGAVLGWFPVDYARDQNPTAILPLLKRCNRILSLSSFGVKQIQKNYTGPCEVVPLGVNNRLFYPVSSESERLALRAELLWPESAFVFLMVGNNFWRKGLEYAIESFYQFKLKYPDLARQAFLYLHTESAEGLIELISVYGLSEQIKISEGFDPYKRPLNQKSLLKLYQASDCLLLTSLGEGFGMPLIEAQACGLPIIASDHSAISEVVGQAGLLIRSPQVICGQSAESIVWLRAPDTLDAADKMAEMMTQSALRIEFSRAGLRQAQAHSWSQTTWLLADALRQCQNLGQPVFEYEEPRMISV
jgi:glycosyltransferase involved in cell wall biosynthesis